MGWIRRVRGWFDSDRTRSRRVDRQASSARTEPQPRRGEGPPSMSRVTRDIVGPTGWVFSDAWQELEDHAEAYRASFDRRLPPSLFVSERDRRRAGQPMPVAERCIEDWSKRARSARGPDSRGARRAGRDNA